MTVASEKPPSWDVEAGGRREVRINVPRASRRDLGIASRGSVWPKFKHVRGARQERALHPPASLSLHFAFAGEARRPWEGKDLSFHTKPAREQGSLSATRRAVPVWRWVCVGVVCEQTPVTPHEVRWI